MQNTLAVNKQMFNVKAIASAGLTPEAIPDNTFAFVDESTNLTVAPTDFNTLPTNFRFISKMGGKVYYSLDSINKNLIDKTSIAKKAYTTQQVQILETTIDHCDCIKGFKFVVHVEDQNLIQRDGLTWAHMDFIVDVAPSEITCLCACDGKFPVYENNVVTKVLVQKINDLNSPFFEARAKISITGLTTYANQGALDTAVPTPTLSALAIVGADLKQYNGSAWVVVGTSTGILTQIDAFIATNKTINTDTNTTNDALKISLVVMGKTQSTPNYKDLEANHVYPRGVKLIPVVSVNDGSKVFSFTQTQALRYEIGAGADIRAEEFETMSLFTNLNHYVQISNGFASNELVYQFENGVNYNTVNFEFSSKKSGLQDVPEGKYKTFSVTLATSVGGVFTSLSNIFA